MFEKCVVGRLALALGFLLLAQAAGAASPTNQPPSAPDWAALAGRADRVIRAECTKAAPVTVAVAGGVVQATEYTFAVRETLQGALRATVVVRQVGRPEGGGGDLGALVGLPTYAPGTEYVLFFLPESRVGLTSPVGAGQGAFVVRGDQLLARPLSHAVVASGGSSARAQSLSLSGLRSALRAVAQAKASR